MKLNKRTRVGVVIIVTVALCMVLFLIGTQSYFNHKEINMASEGCLDQGYSPAVEPTFLSLSYTFTCEDS